MLMHRYLPHAYLAILFFLHICAYLWFLIIGNKDITIVFCFKVCHWLGRKREARRGHVDDVGRQVQKCWLFLPHFSKTALGMISRYTKASLGEFTVWNQEKPEVSKSMAMLWEAKNKSTALRFCTCVEMKQELWVETTFFCLGPFLYCIFLPNRIFLPSQTF